VPPHLFYCGHMQPLLACVTRKPSAVVCVAVSGGLVSFFTCGAAPLFVPLFTECHLPPARTSHRKRGRHLSLRWLCSRARLIYNELYTEPGTPPFRASRGWRRRFCKRHKSARRKKTNSNRKTVEERLPAVREWHTKLAALVSAPRPGKPEQRFDPLYGRFIPWARLNVDQARLRPRCLPYSRVCVVRWLCARFYERAPHLRVYLCCVCWVALGPVTPCLSCDTCA
jgi:hypothetical protein